MSRTYSPLPPLALLSALLAGCGTGVPSSVPDAAVDAPDVPFDGTPEAGPDIPAADSLPDSLPDAVPDVTLDLPALPDGAPAAHSNIRHVIVIVQENHTFDSYFGRYCTAPAGSNPTCTDGPACCERAPTTEPSGASPVALSDAANAGYDPNHSMSCEAAEIHGGLMDRFVDGADCSDPRHFAIAPDDVMATYHGYARSYALADRYFQPIVGATSANDMYLAVAREVFHDNDVGPRAVAHACAGFSSNVDQYTTPTVADLVLGAGFRFRYYAEGYAAARAAAPGCEAAPADCPGHFASYPCTYDPSDVPFEYYSRFTDNPAYMRDYQDLAADLADPAPGTPGTPGALPEVVFVKALGYRTEHPGGGTRISDGEAFVDGILQRVLASRYAADTLVLVTWDEGGGFFDHVAPPGASPVDGEAPGTRVPLLALGRFARRNHVSHVPLEHSSVVRFLEWNFTGATGQLHGRDAVVHNLGSLLDPAVTGTPVPED